MAFKEKLAEQLAMIEAAQAQTGLFDVIIMMMAMINDHGHGGGDKSECHVCISYIFWITYIHRSQIKYRMWCFSRTMIIISGSAESTGSGEGWVVVGDSHQGGDDEDHDDDDDDDDDGGDKSGEGWVLVGESQPGVLPRNLYLLLYIYIPLTLAVIFHLNIRLKSLRKICLI